MKICIVTGGTGGHIYPALALASLWKEQDPDVSIFFIGNNNRMEAELIPQKGFRFYGLHTSGLTGSLMDKAKAVIQMLEAKKQAAALLKKEKPDLVIGFGGYVSAPVLMAAQKLHIPTMVHEQNSVIGKANKVVINKADAVVACYDNILDQLPSDRTRLLGNPRGSLAARVTFDQAYFDELGLDPNLRTILVMMGSLGSSSVNDLMKEALSDLDPGFQVVYAAGRDNSQDLNLFDNECIHVFPFVDTLRLYGAIDGMICRAGATTLAEVTALGIPSIIIPSPYVANNHQFFNAKQLTDRHAAWMIEEKDLNGKTLKKAIQTVFEDDQKRDEMAANARKLGKPNAALDMIVWGQALAAHK